jgi:hypothetical protein
MEGPFQPLADQQGDGSPQGKGDFGAILETLQVCDYPRTKQVLEEHFDCSCVQQDGTQDDG